MIKDGTTVETVAIKTEIDADVVPDPDAPDARAMNLISEVKTEESADTPLPPPGHLTSGLHINNAAYLLYARSSGYTAGGRYPELFGSDAACRSTSLMIPGAGPWYAGKRPLTGTMRVLYFHVPWDRIQKFYVVLQETLKLVKDQHHKEAEQLWIKEGFAIVSTLCA